MGTGLAQGLKVCLAGFGAQLHRAKIRAPWASGFTLLPCVHQWDGSDSCSFLSFFSCTKCSSLLRLNENSVWPTWGLRACSVQSEKMVATHRGAALCAPRAHPQRLGLCWAHGRDSQLPVEGRHSPSLEESGSVETSKPGLYSDPWKRLLLPSFRWENAGLPLLECKLNVNGKDLVCFFFKLTDGKCWHRTV